MVVSGLGSCLMSRFAVVGVVWSKFFRQERWSNVVANSLIS
jgi:hypothetical protein